MQLSLEEKREIIVKNKSPAIAAIQSIIDSYYNFLSPYTNENNVLKKDIFKEEKHKKMAEALQSDVIIYENLLKKIKQDIMLNETEIAYVGIAFQFCAIRAKEQIKNMQSALELCNSISNELSFEKQLKI